MIQTNSDVTDVCASSPCHNGGYCEDSSTPPYYTCQCNGGYTGVNCEEGMFTQKFVVVNK